jgi:riboflavin kinase/FMN adenylyltransferase
MAVVLTFDPHPARLLNPTQAPASLMTVAQKAEALGALGADVLAVLPFTEALSRESPEGFARLVLAGAVGAKQVVVGEGFRFGHARAGGAADLARLGRGLGFGVHALAAIAHHGAVVSSSRIRAHIFRGEMAEANALLGRPYFVDGTVVAGAGRGRTLGIPTANIATPNEVLPARGVYACRVSIGASGPVLTAVANRGTRPTFGGDGEEVLELHLLDFEADVYGRSLRVYFADRLREERAFSGPAELVRQIREDVEAARACLRDDAGSGVS